MVIPVTKFKHPSKTDLILSSNIAMNVITISRASGGNNLTGKLSLFFDIYRKVKI